MSTKLAGIIAITLSLSAMLIVLLFIPMMIQKMSNIQGSLSLKMDEFNVSISWKLGHCHSRPAFVKSQSDHDLTLDTFQVIAEDAWKEIMNVRHHTPKERKTRQTGVCRIHLALFQISETYYN